MTTVSGNPNRPGAFAVVEFKLKDSEVDLLARSRDRALFCYVYNSEAGALTDAFEAPFICFWLDGPLIKKLNDEGAFFRKKGESEADADLPAAQTHARIRPLVRPDSECDRVKKSRTASWESSAEKAPRPTTGTASTA